MTYANRTNRVAYAAKKPRTPESVQTGVRIPLDLVGPMEKVCRERHMTRSRVVIEALRYFLGKPDPASAPVERGQ